MKLVSILVGEKEVLHDNLLFVADRVGYESVFRSQVKLSYKHGFVLAH